MAGSPVIWAWPDGATDEPDAHGELGRQDVRFRPRVPSGGNFVTEAPEHPNDWRSLNYSMSGEGPLRGGPTFE